MLLRTLSRYLTVLALLAAVGPACTFAGPFIDNFEGAALNPFWSTQTDSGSITFPSTAQVHGGNQAVQFNSTSSNSDKFIALYHDFATPVYGRFSVWFYDTGANAPSSNYLSLALYDATNTKSLVVNDYNFGDGATINAVTDWTSYSTGVLRTEAWHQLAITTSLSETIFEIDGSHVFTAAGMGVTKVRLYMSGPSWRPAWTGYFDDFEFQEVPEPSSLVLALTGLGALVVRRRRESRIVEA